MPSRTSKKIFLKITLIALILVTLICSSYFFIRSNRVKEEIKGLLISKLEDSLDRGIYIGKVKKYSLHSLVLSDFKVFQDKALRNEDLLLKADEMNIEFSLDYIQALKRKLALTIQEITFIKPRMTLVRDSEGHLDFFEKFNINLNIFTDFVVKKINIDNGLLYYKDYMTMKEGGLLTSLNSFNGYFNLENLPKVELNCTALRVEDGTPITLKGYFFTGEINYSLDFTFRNSDITHFQYYLTDTKTFNFKKGLFDLDLNLSHFLDTPDKKVLWQGKALAKNIDLYLNYLDGIEIKKINSSVFFNPEEAKIENTSATYQNSSFDCMGNLVFNNQNNFSANIKSSNFDLNDLKDILALNFALPDDFQITGKSVLELQADGTIDNYLIKGEWAIGHGIVEGYDFSDFNMEFDYDQNGFQLKNLRAECGGGIIEGKGTIILKENIPEYNLFVSFSKFDMKSDFIKSFNLDYFPSGLLYGNVQMKGKLTEGESIKLKSEIKLEDKKDIYSLQAEGEINEKNFFDFKIKTNEINLERLGEVLNFEGLKGLGNFNGYLSGFPGDLRIFGKVIAKNGEIFKLPFDSLEGEFDFEDNILQFEEMSFKEKELTFRGKGNIDFSSKNKDINLNLTIQLEEADIEYFSAFFDNNLPVSGFAQGEISIQGSLSRITAKGNLKLRKVDLVLYKADSGNLNFEFKDNKLKIKNAILNSGKTQIYAQGEINLEKDSTIDLRVNFLDQDIPALLSNFVQVDLLRKFRGQATGSFEVRGDLKSPDLYLSAIIEDAQLDEIPLNSIEVKLEKISSVLRFNTLKLSQRKGELIANGWINFDEENKNLDLNISAQNIDLNQFSNILGLEEEIKGLVNFKATATGNIELPKITFLADIKKGEFQDFTFDNLIVEALFDQEFLEVKQFILDKEGHQIKGNGKIPYEFSFMEKEKRVQSLADIPLDFTLSLKNTDLSFMRIFFKEDIKQIQGLTDVELVLSGTLNQPILNGNIVLKDGSIELYRFPVKVSDINTLLQIEDNLVKIKDINFKINQYKLYALGEFKIKDLQPQEFSINIWSNNEGIVYQDIFKANTDLNLKLTSIPSSPSIKGILTISQGEFDWKENKEVLFNLSELMSVFKLNNIESGSLDIEIKILDEFIAKTKDFTLKTTGNLHLQGNLATPQLNGELGIRQGHITFLDKKFRVLNGKIIFSDFLGRNVILDIEAKTEIDNIDVFIQVGGDMLQPSITLSSSPVLTENEIISLLMFNKNFKGLTEGEISSILREEMINLIAQGLSVRFLNQIENQVANSLGLDEFKIETIFKKDEDSNTGFLPGLALEGLALKFGKYFTEKFYLTYSAPLYEAGKGNIGLEYKISDDLIFSTQIGEFSPQDNDFEFKFELKYGF